MSDLFLIGKSKKKLYNLPRGDYRGIVQCGLCYLYDNSGKIFFRFDSDIKQKGQKILEVIVKANDVIAKIYLNV